MPGMLHGVFPALVTCTVVSMTTIRIIMPVTIPVSIFLPVTMVLLYMIYILTMTNIMRPMAGTIRTVPMITGAGTVDVEGETDDPEVLALRHRMIRNACAVLMCSRGTPMFLSGDEFGNTKFGNNNSYCQDNITSWLDWRMLEKNKDIFEFFKFMIAYRKAHPVIHKKLPNAVCGLDPIHTHNTNAREVGYSQRCPDFLLSVLQDIIQKRGRMTLSVFQ